MVTLFLTFFQCDALTSEFQVCFLTFNCKKTFKRQKDSTFSPLQTHLPMSMTLAIIPLYALVDPINLYYFHYGPICQQFFLAQRIHIFFCHKLGLLIAIVSCKRNLHFLGNVIFYQTKSKLKKKEKKNTNKKSK